MKKNYFAICLVLMLLFSCLNGCGKQAETPKETVPPADTGVPTPVETAAPSEAQEDEPSDELDALNEAYRKFSVAYEKYSPDTVVMHVNGRAVPWSEYFSWVYNIASQMDDRYAVEDWSADCVDLIGLAEDPSYNSYISSYAAVNCMQLSVIADKAEELDAGLDAAQEATLAQIFDSYYAQFDNDPEAFAAAIAKGFLTVDYFKTQYRASMTYDNLMAKIFGPGGENCPEEDAIQYVKDQGYLNAKHILFKTVDDYRQPLSDEVVAQKKADAEQVLAQLRACAPEQLPARFEELMLQYNEDPGMSTYTDGYYFLSGAMVAPFENATRALGDNELSDIVESNYGYHIIFRPAMSGEDLMDYDDNYQPYTVRSFAASALFSNVADGWYSAAEVEFMPGFDHLDLNELLAD